MALTSLLTPVSLIPSLSCIISSAFRITLSPADEMYGTPDMSISIDLTSSPALETSASSSGAVT